MTDFSNSSIPRCILCLVDKLCPQADRTFKQKAFSLFFERLLRVDTVSGTNCAEKSGDNCMALAPAFVSLQRAHRFADVAALSQIQEALLRSGKDLSVVLSFLVDLGLPLQLNHTSESYPELKFAQERRKLFAFSVPDITRSQETEDEGFAESPKEQSSPAAQCSSSFSLQNTIAIKHSAIWHRSFERGRPLLFSEASNQLLQAALTEHALLYSHSTPRFLPLSCVIRSLLNILLGYPDNIVHLNHDLSLFSLRDHWTCEGTSQKSFRCILRPLLDSGSQVLQLRDLLESDFDKKSTIQQALRSDLKTILQEYCHFVYDTCTSIDRRHKLLKLLLTLKERASMISLLSRLYMVISDRTSLEVLQTIHETAALYPQSNEINRILNTCFRIFDRYLNLLLNSGKIDDIHEEFPISVRNSALAARDRTFWRNVFVLGEFPSENAQTSFLFKVKFWRKIVTTGKSARLLAECGQLPRPRCHRPVKTDDFPPSDEIFGRSFQLLQPPRLISVLSPDSSSLCNVVCSSIETDVRPTFGMADAQSGDLQRYFEKASEINSEVRSVLLRYIRTDCNLDKILTFLRQTFFLANGSFARTLSERLFTVLEANGTNVQRMFAPHLMNAALDCSLDEMHLEEIPALSFYVNDLPDQIDVTSPRFLNILHLKIKVEWPCNILLTDELLQFYDEIFAFLLGLRWALHNLRNVGEWLNNNKRMLRRTGDFHRLSLCKREFEHYLLTLQAFLANQLIEVCWHRFMIAVESAPTLDHLHVAHKEYLTSCLCKCMLNPKAHKLRLALDKLLQKILEFCSVVCSLNAYDDCSPAYALTDTFTTYAKHFVFVVLAKLADRGYDSSLSDLLMRLNFNGFYDS